MAGRDTHDQRSRNAITRVCERRGALAVPNAVRKLAHYWRRRRAPEITRFGIANVDHVAHGITYRIVVPWRDAIEVAVARPYRSRASLGYQESAVIVRDYVEPWGRGHLITAYANAIRAGRVHTADPVVKEQVIRFVQIARTRDARVMPGDGETRRIHWSARVGAQPASLARLRRTISFRAPRCR